MNKKKENNDEEVKADRVELWCRWCRAPVAYASLEPICLSRVIDNRLMHCFTITQRNYNAPVFISSPRPQFLNAMHVYVASSDDGSEPTLQNRKVNASEVERLDDESGSNRGTRLGSLLLPPSRKEKVKGELNTREELPLCCSTEGLQASFRFSCIS
ncbi:hypothetical protein KQX54_021576 [Cotesia glomerata]|uniref:Uncharacterized protein n=1 Tax=Cotesia glomerata TaxID=32391 RepID=A0AAV7J746_COTGL|nr:hypothetical protein KQX54_021576 [Cotesia glomerata]